MKMGAALLAVVIVRDLGIAHNTNATTVLPDLADVTLYEHVAGILGVFFSSTAARRTRSVLAVMRFAAVREWHRHAGIIRLAAHTARDCVLLVIVFNDIGAVGFGFEGWTMACIFGAFSLPCLSRLWLSIGFRRVRRVWEGPRR